MDPDLDIPVEADRRHEDPVQVLEGRRPVLLLVDVEGKGVFGQVQQDAHGRALGDAPLRPTKTHTHG